MVPVIHRIDPEPDTVIILKKPCLSFAKWDPLLEQTRRADHAEWEAWVYAASLRKKGKNKHKKARSKPTRPLVSEELASTTMTDEQSSVSCSGINIVAEASAATEVSPNFVVGELPFNATEALHELEEDEIHYYVSSRHLMMASPIFRRALKKDGCIESSRNDDDGHFHIAASGWDEEAFLIVLQIFHLRNKVVPRLVSLEMIAKIAILVDYYDCAEALEMFSSVWIAELMNTPIPENYCRDLILWIWVAWAFDLSTLFESATVIAVHMSPEPLRTLNLPIPTKISDDFELVRNRAIESVVENLHALLGTYRSASYECPNSSEQSALCGAVMLGTLTREMEKLALLEPRPEVPFSNLTLRALCEKLEEIVSPRWVPYRNGYGGRLHNCGLTEAINVIVVNAMSEVIVSELTSLKRGVPDEMQD